MHDLNVAAAELRSQLASAQHDLWTNSGTFNVADTRVDDAERLQKKGVANWIERDLDYVMFKCMTTMGGAPTFWFILPRFLQAVAQNPDYGWTSQTHVLSSKIAMLDLSKLTRAQASAMREALCAYAKLEWAMEQDEISAQAPSDVAKLIADAEALV